MDKKKITFVCHSMGGVVARYLLCEQRDAFKDKQVGIVLIASPSYGSPLARSLDEVIYLYNHMQGTQLNWGSETLKDLDQRFRNLKESGNIPNLSGVEFFEERFVIRWKWLPLFARTRSSQRNPPRATSAMPNRSVAPTTTAYANRHQDGSRSSIPARIPSRQRSSAGAKCLPRPRKPDCECRSTATDAPDDSQARLGLSSDATTKSPTLRAEPERAAQMRGARVRAAMSRLLGSIFRPTD